VRDVNWPEREFQRLAQVYSGERDEQLLSILDGATGVLAWREQLLRIAKRLHGSAVGGQYGFRQEEFVIV
jgi:hypothetical protein